MVTFVIESDQVSVPEWVVDLASFRRWMAMDVWYARHWTPLLDFWILVRTIPAVIRGEGAW